MDEVEALKKGVEYRKNKLGLINSSLILTSLKQKTPVTAIIERDFSTIRIFVSDDYEPVHDEPTKIYATTRNISDPIGTILKSLVDHEVGHWRYIFPKEWGCPCDIIHLEKIESSIAKALNKRAEDRGVQYVTNIFEDLIDNANIYHQSGHMDGLLFVLYEQGYEKPKGYSPLFETFVRLNLHLMGNQGEDYKLVERFFNTGGKADLVANKLENITRILGLSDEEHENHRRLMQKGNWPDLAHRFALEIKDILDAPEALFGAPSHAIKKEQYSEEGQKTIIKHKFEEGEDRPQNKSREETLKMLYETLADHISIRVKAKTKGLSLPIIHYNYHPFDEEVDDPRGIDLNRIIFDESGLTFAVPRDKIDYKIPLSDKLEKFPDLIFGIDESGSMMGELEPSNKFLEWGRKSKFHYALCGFFGILKYLELERIAPLLHYEAITFSDNTLTSGRRDYGEIDKVKKFVVKKPQCGWTNLEINVLKKAVGERENLIIMLSDGEIQNWGKIKDEFRKIIDRNLFSFIEIGGMHATGSDLRKWGKKVYPVENKKDLVRLQIEIAKSEYDKFIRRSLVGFLNG